MPGRWYLDDDQSLYYLDSEESKDIEPTLELDNHASTTLSEQNALWDSAFVSDNQVGCASEIPSHHVKPSLEASDSLHKPEFLPNAPSWPQLEYYTDTNFMEDSSATAPLDSAAFCTSTSTALCSPSTRVDIGTSPRQTQLNPWEDTDRLLRLTRRATSQDSTSVFARSITADQVLLRPSSMLNLVMGYNTSLPRSQFDSYITALRQLVRCSLEKDDMADGVRRAVTAEGVLWVVREAWPAAEGYWNLTATFRGFLHAELWRNFPCERTYRQLPPEYRPTRAQLLIPHSPMIDWMPWPDLRDLAIMYQDQLDVDELFRMAIHNVIAHRKRMSNSSRQRIGNSAVSSRSMADVKNNVSFRVWDMACFEKSNGINPLADSMLVTRPVLQSSSLRALIRAYDLEYDDFGTQKLDRSFFETFPYLYCETAASTWEVENFQALSREDVGRPVPLSRPAVYRLKSTIEGLTGTRIDI